MTRLANFIEALKSIPNVYKLMYETGSHQFENSFFLSLRSHHHHQVHCRLQIRGLELLPVLARNPHVLREELHSKRYPIQAMRNHANK